MTTITREQAINDEKVRLPISQDPIDQIDVHFPREFKSVHITNVKSGHSKVRVYFDM